MNLGSRVTLGIGVALILLGVFAPSDIEKEVSVDLRIWGLCCVVGAIA